MVLYFGVSSVLQTAEPYFSVSTLLQRQRQYFGDSRDRSAITVYYVLIT